jgi:hypothetical protein
MEKHFMGRNRILYPIKGKKRSRQFKAAGMKVLLRYVQLNVTHSMKKVSDLL